MYTLIGSDGKPYQSIQKGAFGGHKRLKIYRRLDCPSANWAIANGHYVKHRVFFADEATAIDAGYRPCGGNCMKEQYSLWIASFKAPCSLIDPGIPTRSLIRSKLDSIPASNG